MSVFQCQRVQSTHKGHSSTGPLVSGMLIWLTFSLGRALCLCSAFLSDCFLSLPVSMTQELAKTKKNPTPLQFKLRLRAFFLFPNHSSLVVTSSDRHVKLWMWISSGWKNTALGIGLIFETSSTRQSYFPLRYRLLQALYPKAVLQWQHSSRQWFIH